MIKNLLIFFTLIFTYEILLSCTCSPPSQPFCNSLSVNSHIAEIIVIEKHGFCCMEVVVIDEWNLDIEEDTIFILGADGFNCGLNLEMFSIGDSLILGLYNGNVETPEFLGQDINWSLGGCHVNYLRVKNDSVVGIIREDINSQLKEDLKINLLECLDLELGYNDFEVKSNPFSIFPNPVTNIVSISGEDVPIEQIELYNIRGEEILKRINILDVNFEVNLKNTPSGVYFLKIRTEKKEYWKKILKE